MILSTCRRILQDKLAPISFGIVSDTGHHFFVVAHDFKVDCKGRLVLWLRRWLVLRRVVSVVEAGKWERILRGITWDDVKLEG
jgi:hypothetical protein